MQEMFGKIARILVNLLPDIIKSALKKHNNTTDKQCISLPTPFPCSSCDLDISKAIITSAQEQHKSTLSFDFSNAILSTDREHFVMIAYKFPKPIDLTKYRKCHFYIRFDNNEIIDKIHMQIKKYKENKQRPSYIIKRQNEEQDITIDLLNEFPFEIDALKNAGEICFTIKLTNTPFTDYKGSFTIRNLTIRKDN